MSTNLAIVTDALRILGVLSETETASAEMGAHALGRMNRMIERWTEDGIELGYFAQTSTADDCPVPLWAEEGVISKLAQNLRPVYPSSSLDPSVFDDTQNGFGTIQRRCLMALMKPASMSHLPMGSGHCAAGTSILTDE